MADPPIKPRYLIHPPLIGMGAGLLIAVFLTDELYRRSLLFQWSNFSMWLILGGLFVAFFGAAALIADALRGAVGAFSWIRFAGFTVAALLSILNAFVHTRDAYTAVMPLGWTISLIVAVILIVLGCSGWSLRAAPRPRATGTQETSR